LNSKFTYRRWSVIGIHWGL